MKTKKLLLATKPVNDAANWTSLLLRLAFPFFLFYGHGMFKLGKIFSGAPIQFADPIGLGQEISFYLAAFAEGICVLFVFFGLFTRLALIPLIITMAVIVFIQHSGAPFGNIEMALAYFVAFIAIFLLGPGKHSLDNLLSK